MVFKSPDARTFKVKFSIPTRNGGKSRTFSTGMRDKAAARDVERMVERMRGRREWTALEAVFDGSLTLAKVYDADVSGTLAALVSELRDVDLDPLVTEWAMRSWSVYVKQVRAFIPSGQRFPASRFRRKAISEFLAKLDVSPPTKNRYRAALSVFARWLVEREVIEANPVRDVAMYKEAAPRMVWMTWEECERVAGAAPHPYNVLYALMAATGMEVSAALQVTRADLDLESRTVRARGSKTAWRNRVVRYEAWADRFLGQYVQAIGAVPLFPGISRYMALWHFRAAQKAVGLTGHRLHDLRHSYAVNALRKGYKAQVVAVQLGHKDTTLLSRVYGRFVPDASDYDVPGSATNSATTSENPREANRAK